MQEENGAGEGGGGWTADVAFELKAGQRALHLHCLVIMSKMLAVVPLNS